VKADLYTADVRAAAGAGLAYRTAAGFVVLAASDGGNLIGLIESKQHEPDLIEHIAAQAPTSTKGFAMLFTAGGELHLVATGEVTAVISSPSTELVLRPTGDQVLVHPVSAAIGDTAVTIRLQNNDMVGGTNASLELATGTIDADWVEVGVGEAEIGDFVAPLAPQAAAPTAAAEPIPTPAPEPAPTPALAPTPAPAPVIPAPAPVIPTPAPVAPADVPVAGTPVMVLGVSCQQGHHNHPDAVYCSQCGTKMGVHQTTVLANGPRPPLGVLVVDDGTTYSLSENLVIGREPASHAAVQSGHASPMILTDDTLSLSRKHAQITLNDWSVLVEDLGSSNGTYLSRAGQSEVWTRVEPSAAKSLEPGDRLRVGGRIIQIELHHVR